MHATSALGIPPAQNFNPPHGALPDLELALKALLGAILITCLMILVRLSTGVFP